MNDMLGGAVILLFIIVVIAWYIGGRSRNPTPTRKPTGASIPATGSVEYSEGVNWQPDTREPWIVTAERIANAPPPPASGGHNRPNRYER